MNVLWRILPALAVLQVIPFAFVAYMSYTAHTEQLDVLRDVQTSTQWDVHQASLEHARLMGAFDALVTRQTDIDDDDLDHAELRLAIFVSRIDILAVRTANAPLAIPDGYQETMSTHSKVSRAMLSELRAARHSASTPADLQRIATSLRPIGTSINMMLADMVLYSTEMQRRQEIIAGSRTRPALILLIASLFLGYGLNLLQLWRSQRLNERLAVAIADERNAINDLNRLLDTIPSGVMILSQVSDTPLTKNARVDALGGPSMDELMRCVGEIREKMAGEGSVPAMSSGEAQLTLVNEEGLGRRLNIRVVYPDWSTEKYVVYVQDLGSTGVEVIKAAETARMITLGHITGAVAHELNQPLAVIRAAAENGLLLLRSHSPNSMEAALAKLERIANHAARAGRIVSQIQRYVMPPDDGDAPFIVKDRLNNAIGYVADTMRAEQVALHLDIRDRFAKVLGDGHLFEQVLVNILYNAVEAFRARPREGKTVSIKLKRVSRRVVIAILDNAGGLSAQVAADPFAPFATTKGSAGSGLGLAITKAGVTAMGGTIRLRSFATGVAVLVTLPVAGDTHVN
ncbi:His Kinase A (phospho-acceptor) domain-containing protein [Devosia enhydra]|uniref:histidine kinase n=1 Tax=Devosia enhydra TaxID=665118 RepID=A0A1K2HZ95_9HYPH|nr:ATP-binding protein [Devosia enhydra]SFZ85409.1 His Kinase A (phospho-acceptor) domain-containing protein [Devosia enhydra]